MVSTLQHWAPNFKAHGVNYSVTPYSYGTSIFSLQNFQSLTICTYEVFSSSCMKSDSKFENLALNFNSTLCTFFNPRHRGKEDRDIADNKTEALIWLRFAALKFNADKNYSEPRPGYVRAYARAATATALVLAPPVVSGEDRFITQGSRRCL